MDILIFNNKDIMNPNSGGSEVFTHEVAKRWVEWGNKVTMIVSNYPGGKQKETIDGVEIIRLGNMISVYLLSRLYYKKHLQGKYDVIIDEYTYKPFMTPKFVKEQVIFLVHELAREKWFYEAPFPISYLGYFLEPRWIKTYRDTPTVTVSESTKRDLLSYDIKQVYIVPEGLNFTPFSSVPEKENEPTILFVGLLKKANLVDHAIEAFKIVTQEIPNARLWIVGRGYMLDKLKKMARGLNVTFFGYVSEKKKIELMSRAHILVVPAIREGWGLVVTEANACGTPAIGYNVPGLRDSIKHKETGILVDPSPKELANAVIELLQDKERLLMYSKNALEWSRNFSWDKTAKEFMKVLEEATTDG